MKLQPPSRRRLVRAAVITLAVGLAAYLGLSIFGAVAAMTIPRLPVAGSPADVGLSYEDVSFPSRVDSVRLTGWFISGAGRDVVIIVHGGFQARVDNTVDTLPLAAALEQRGFSLLLFDLRGRGDSAGTGRSLSNIERDVGGAVDYVLGRGYTRSEVGLLGF
ncbi:MAG TPA: alpha/beta hydrolase, partial [bacterium]|nr:alpha/beta hydrolase [bacterium]